MEIELKWKEGMHFEGETPSRHVITYDSGPRDAVTRGFSPMEALLQSAAVCSGMDIVSILEKKRKKPVNFTVRISGERADKHPKVFTKIDISYIFQGNGLTERDAEQAIKLSVDKYCSVLAMMRDTAEISWDYSILK